MSRAESLPSTPFARLLDGETLGAPPPLGKIEAVELLDFMADINHGPTGAGPESPGAAFGLRVLGHYLECDPEGRALIDVVRSATAYENAAERRAPSATITSEAAEGLNLLSSAPAQQHWGRHWVAVALPTPMHARYALALLVADGGAGTELFAKIADHLVEHEEAGDDDVAYVERLRAETAEPRTAVQ